MAGIAAIHAAVRVTQTNVVKDIKGFSSELPFDPFRNPEILKEGHIGVEPARPGKRIATCVAKRTNGRTFPRTTGVSIVGQSSGGTLVPMIPRGIGNCGIAYQIGSTDTDVLVSPAVRIARREALAAHPDEVKISLPAADNKVERS